MKFFDYIRFGLKNILRSKARTFLTIFAVVIGATSVVLMLTIIFGAKQTALSQLEDSGVLTQITVTSSTDSNSNDVFSANGGPTNADSIKLTDALFTKVKAIPNITSSYVELNPYPLSNAVVTDETGAKVNIQQIVAYEPGTATDKKMAAGRNLQTSDVYSMIVGQEELKKLGYKDNAAGVIGKVITFGVQGYVGDDKDIPLPPTQQPGNQNGQNDYFQSLQKHIDNIKITIVGVLASGPFDSESFIPMQLGRKVMTSNMWQQQQQPQQDCAKKPGACIQTPPTYVMISNDQFDQQGYTNFVLLADTLDHVDGVATKVKAMGLGASTAKDIIAQIEQIFKLVSIVFGAIGGISLLVAAIGVINTMIMATLERTREIGVMRACGATKGGVRRLFTFEAALLGFWGGAFGVGVAYLLMFLVKQFAGDQLTSQGIPLGVLSIPIWLALTTMAVTTVVGMLAGFGPAVRASRLNPVEALRYE